LLEFTAAGQLQNDDDYDYDDAPDDGDDDGD